ncbi:MAG: 16S rRNA (guanine(527)-N(7))-methyltransferase RsmG [Rhodospirillaceae bacterium]|nr:16S rRNA (guanine(527)-N(7))-methyltransferase RsmG [Rhodospirillaceae bacterium]
MGEGAFGPEAFAARTGVSRETLAALERYAALLVRWQRRINLVSPGSLGALWWRHMFDSAQLHPLLPLGTRTLLDIGSGAGFPGLVLAAMGVPAVHLVESDTRKGVFLREAARVVAPGRVRVHAVRVERLAPFPVDVVTARAVAPIATLLRLAAPFLAPHTVCLFLKGARAEEELTAAAKEWTMRMARVASLTDPRATILKLDRIAREPGTRNRLAHP